MNLNEHINFAKLVKSFKCTVMYVKIQVLAEVLAITKGTYYFISICILRD